MSPGPMFSKNRPNDRYGGRKDNSCSTQNDQAEMEPLTELPSNEDDLTSNDLESWLETSSKYHSCELVEGD